MTFEELRDKALSLPLLPGVYIMMDASGDVIYVGKAKALKNRVSSYFHGDHPPKVAAMVSKIHSFDVIVASSEFEALVLENSLIKHHQPRYNILLRDDKTYPFLRIDLREEYPVFTIVSRPAGDGAKYLGPYGGRTFTRQTLDAVLKAFRLPTCSRRFPRDIGKGRPCLNHHLGTCDAFCRPGASKEAYRERIGQAVAVFEGKLDEIVAQLTEEMNAAAEALQFERAAELRDRIRAVLQVTERQYVVAGSKADTDVVGFYTGEAKSCFVVLHYIGGNLLGKDFDIIETPVEEEGEAVSGLLRQYYATRGVYPRTICVPVDLPDKEPLERLFSEASGHRVYIEAPKRGDKARLIERAQINAREETERATTREEKTLKTLEWLQKALRLPAPPERIEAFDISNTGGSDIVASMTVFVKGKPLKRGYRRFKIKTLEGQDDYHSMMEVISRRAARYKEGDEKFTPLPDLMLIDGGQAHAAAAESVLIQEGLNVPVCGMVKDARHRTRALVLPDGQEIGIAANPAVFALIGTIQEETHRFAIEYHRSLRSKSTVASKLDAIEGVGKKRREKLLKRFGSLRAIAGASVEELSEVVPRPVAERIKEQLGGQSGEKEQQEETAASEGE